MTFFTCRTSAANTPFTDLEMDSTKYHRSHFKLAGLFKTPSSFSKDLVEQLPEATLVQHGALLQKETGLCDLANYLMEADKRCQYLTGQIVVNVV